MMKMMMRKMMMMKKKKTKKNKTKKKNNDNNTKNKIKNKKKKKSKTKKTNMKMKKKKRSIIKIFQRTSWRLVAFWSTSGPRCWKFREIPSNFRESSGEVQNQCNFRESSIRGKFRESSGKFRESSGESRENSGKIQGNVHTGLCHIFIKFRWKDAISLKWLFIFRILSKTIFSVLLNLFFEESYFLLDCVNVA